jgi:tetratricopeptide (TPR) repeat protein
MKFSRLLAVLPAAFLFSIIATAQAPEAESFEQLARRAESLLDSQPAEAATLYKQALAIRPDWAEGWFYLGATLYQQDRYAEATDAFRKGIALVPQQGTAWAFLGLSESMLGDPEQALADIRKGEQLGLGDNLQFEVAARVKAAQLLVRSSSFDEALVEMQALARKEVDSDIVIETMGLCAVSMPYKLSELSPDQRAAIRLVGKAAWAGVRQRPAEAIATYKEVIEKYPKEPGVHYAHGGYLMETDLNAALAEFQTEIRNTPKHWPSYIMIASLQMRQGAAGEAKESLKQAMKLAPVKYRWLCHAEMGRANLISDNLEGAISELQTALRQSPTYPQVHFLLAQAYRRAGRAEEANKESAEFQKLKVQQDPLGVPSLQNLLAGKQ